MPIVQRTRGRRRRDSWLLKDGSAFYAPAASAIAMAESSCSIKNASCPAPQG